MAVNLHRPFSQTQGRLRWPMSEYIIRRYRTDARPPAFTIAASETSPKASRAAAAYRQHDEAAIASTG
ncbi:MAG: hypothetical protein QOH78_79, partial [Verrucomicrobiota bacterium]